MKYYQGIVLCCVMLLVSSQGCKDSDGTDLKITELYKTKDRIVPLAEYTEDNPREWEKVAGEHVPEVALSRKNGEEAVVISVPLKKASMEHYIEKIGIMDEKGKDIISESMPRQANPRTHAFFLLRDVPREMKGLKAYAKCNLHDLWTGPLPLE